MTWTTFLSEAIGLLVGGITSVASGIGQGLSTLVNALVVTGTGSDAAMSAFAAIIFVFAGISLALGLSRWVVNLIGSLGQRNR